MDDLLNIAPCGILLFDDGGNVLRANKTLKDLLGYNDQELEGKTVDNIFSVATRIFYNTHLFPVIKLHSRADEIFLTLVTKDKKDIPVLSNTVRRQNDGKFENLSVFVPLFERKKFEEEILQARRTAENALKENKQLQALTETLESRTRELEKKNQKIVAVNDDLTQFNKIISHDLQEPIRKIRLFTSMLTASGSDQMAERSRMALTKIESATERLSKLTLSLQQYVNVDADVKYTLVDLNDSLSAAASRVRASRKFDDFELVSGHLPSIEGFPAQLELLFYHLVDNAIQYRNPDRKLKIMIDHTVLEENVYRSIPDKYNFMEHVRIICSDNGVGFDNQFKEYVFDMIKKINIGTEGIGMGLALIKKIVSNHGGTVTVESRHGEGTQFTMVLPLRMGQS
jgi:sigma-B regulation protein RsbU (phosphoserine phosphatase)